MSVLLIGGPSGVGKSTVAAQLAERLGSTWVQVDDLRLALERSGLPVPRADAVPTFDGPGGLVALGEFMAPAIEAVVENHVDQRNPAVIEGDGILPSLLDRPSLRARAADVRAVFLHEPDENALHEAMQTRQRGLADRAHARKNHLFGQWLETEAERRGLPTVAARPLATLADRVLTAIVLHRTSADPPIELRPIAPSERDELLAAARRYWLDLMPRWRGNRDPEYQAAYFVDRFRLDAADSTHWWAILDGQRIGFAKIDLAEDQDGPWADWRDFYVERAHRRKGHGRAFARAIVAELHARGYYKIDLNVRHDNPTALAFWRSVGFDLAGYRMRMYLG